MTEVDALRRQLGGALTEASKARLGVRSNPELEPLVRSYGRASREAGMAIEDFLLAVKHLVRDSTGTEKPIFTPEIVGWAIAG